MSVMYIYVFTSSRGNMYSPIPLPIFGNVVQKYGYNLADWYTLLHKKYGDMFEVYYAGERKVVLSRPDLIENINNNSTKTKYPNRFEDTEGLTEYGVSAGVGNNNEPKSWRFNRQFFTQALFSSKFEHLAIEWINELWEEIDSYWSEIDENKEFDLVEWMQG
ncbi:19004_t:CDS:2 [Racocetra persica]|uniref:19004_t:CDS:1 n=1 Tax=Racocetra persica TaxID=160502 RepID=A0ACA9KUC4_9GLOM|nr:19004_t:CDS:2 [Racocetra persica]